jgi:type II secretion system protein G
MKLPRQKGFTLIEILIVISILGIISTVALGNFRNSQLKGRDLRRKEDLRHLKAAVELYYNDYGRYPSADGGGRILGCPTSSSAPCEWGVGTFTDGKTLYEQKVPADPSRTLTYFYKTSSDASRYQIFARLENTKDPMILTGLNVDCGVTCNYGVSSPNVQVTDSL